MSSLPSDLSAEFLEDLKRVDLRVPEEMFRGLRDHVEDFTSGEQAGFLICGETSLPGYVVLVARHWIPVPPDEVRRDKKGFMLAWSPALNARVLEQASDLGGSVVLVHSHGDSIGPRLSPSDERNAKSLFPAMSRLLLGRTSGSVVLGSKSAAGLFWMNGKLSGNLRTIHVVGAVIEKWGLDLSHIRPVRRSLDRQSRAIGPRSDSLLADSTVAVLGLSGGGSHVVQQLVHQGVGRIIGVDDQLIEEVQLGRMVGSRKSDVDVVYKTAAMSRLAKAVDPGVVLDEVRERFPALAVRQALLQADLVVACVDSFSAREQINAFCRRYHLPLIDIGMNIETGDDDQLVSASGQVAVVVPDSPCLRCGPLLSDAVLARELTERPPGYDRNPDALGDPQVVSMNGVLASEAANSTLDMITGFSGGARGAAWWLYDGRRGALERCEHSSPRPSCPACVEQGHADGTV